MDIEKNALPGNSMREICADLSMELSAQERLIEIGMKK